MAKRRRFSRWRRLPGVYRTGEEKLPDPNQELERLSLYVTWELLDRAEAQAQRLGFATVHDYCADLLSRAIGAEHVREQVADVEAKRGPLEGLHAISDDPEYLAELSGVSPPREPSALDEPIPPVPIRFLDPEPVIPSAAAEVVMRHAGQAGDDPRAFLPSLRRGEAVAPEGLAELAQALHDLEREHRGAPAMDRRLTFALHRLAFESQILHTDAWPGAFDVWTVDTLRAVQEAVERILSGQDIRYYPDAQTPALGPSPRPETPR